MKMQSILVAAAFGLVLTGIKGLTDSDRENALQLVEPEIPDSFSITRDGGQASGMFEVESGSIEAIRLQEGQVIWELVPTYSDGELVAIEKKGENPSLGRSIKTHITFETDSHGRIQAQHVNSRGMRLYEIQYSYGSSEVPQTASVIGADGQLTERLRYEYGAKSWSHPLYLFSGLHFGQVRTYSDHGNGGGELELFAVGAYSPNDWRIQSLTMPVSPSAHTEVQRFNYEPNE